MIKGRDYVAVAAVTICHDGAGNYLLGKRSEECNDERSRWDLLGSGTVEFGEKLEDTIHREVKEETGADVEQIEYLGFREVLRDAYDGMTHWVAFDYKVTVNREQAHNAEPEKCDEICWCRLEDFPEPMHSQWPVFYKKYKDKL